METLKSNIAFILNCLDARANQITALCGLLGLGIFYFDIAVSGILACTIVCSALLAQYLCTRTLADLQSALISSLSLCLLLRTHDLSLAIGAALIAICGKKFIKINGQHFFNPSALALVLITFCFDGAWLSPGQWGHGFNLVIVVTIVGLAVTRSVSRIDVSLSFLATYAFICFGRASYLGDPFSIPLHQLNNGALLIFTFFMISDPRTTPSEHHARLFFGLLVACLSAYLNFGLHQANAPLYSLVMLAPLVPFFDHFLPARTFVWKQTPASSRPKQLIGVPHG